MPFPFPGQGGSTAEFPTDPTFTSVNVVNNEGDTVTLEPELIKFKDGSTGAEDPFTWDENSYITELFNLFIPSTSPSPLLSFTNPTTIDFPASTVLEFETTEGLTCNFTAEEVEWIIGVKPKIFLLTESEDWPNAFYLKGDTTIASLSDGQPSHLYLGRESVLGNIAPFGDMIFRYTDDEFIFDKDVISYLHTFASKSIVEWTPLTILPFPEYTYTSLAIEETDYSLLHFIYDSTSSSSRYTSTCFITKDDGNIIRSNYTGFIHSDTSSDVNRGFLLGLDAPDKFVLKKVYNSLGSDTSDGHRYPIVDPASSTNIVEIYDHELRLFSSSNQKSMIISAGQNQILFTNRVYYGDMLIQQVYGESGIQVRAEVDGDYHTLFKDIAIETSASLLQSAHITCSGQSSDGDIFTFTFDRPGSRDETSVRYTMRRGTPGSGLIDVWGWYDKRTGHGFFDTLDSGEMYLWLWMCDSGRNLNIYFGQNDGSTEDFIIETQEIDGTSFSVPILFDSSFSSIAELHEDSTSGWNFTGSHTCKHDPEEVFSPGDPVVMTGVIDSLRDSIEEALPVITHANSSASPKQFYGIFRDYIEGDIVYGDGPYRGVVSSDGNRCWIMSHGNMKAKVEADVYTAGDVLVLNCSSGLLAKATSDPGWDVPKIRCLETVTLSSPDLLAVEL